MFMTEFLSIYIIDETEVRKEYIKAVQVSGTSNESITQFMGDMYQKVNVYENYIDVFGKSFCKSNCRFWIDLLSLLLER